MEIKETPVAKVGCPTCRGTGSVGNIEEAVPGEQHTLGDFRSKCDLCDGTGKVLLSVYNKELETEKKQYFDQLRREIQGYGN